MEIRSTTVWAVAREYILRLSESKLADFLQEWLLTEDIFARLTGWESFPIWTTLLLDPEDCLDAKDIALVFGLDMIYLVWSWVQFQDVQVAYNE